MIFKDIQVDDTPLFNDFDYICSDYVFSYLYMYCELYKLKIYHDDKTVIIRSDLGRPSFHMPLGDTEYGINMVKEYCLKNSLKPVFTKIPGKYTEIFKVMKFRLKEDRNSFDYIFMNSELAEYDGKDFRKQRNNLSSYLKTYSPSYTEDITAHTRECKEFVLTHYDGNTSIINPTFRMLDSMEHFNCSGGIVWDGSAIQGFCVYEKVSSDTVLSHIELTDNAHRGIHTYMINEMSGRIPEKYVNKEDDMGLAGLRRFKETYNPCHMLKKYIACPE